MLHSMSVNSAEQERRKFYLHNLIKHTHRPWPRSARVSLGEFIALSSINITPSFIHLLGTVHDSIYYIRGISK